MSTNTAQLDSIAGFKILPLTLPPASIVCFKSFAKISAAKSIASTAPVEPSCTEHFLFFKKHESKNEAVFPKGRTLFLSNLPVNTSENHLKRLFRRCGTIRNIIWKQDLSTTNAAFGLDQRDLIVKQALLYSGHPMDSSEDMETQSDSADLKSVSVCSTYMWSLISSGSTCHVIFEEADAVDRCMNMKQRKRVWSDVISDESMKEDSEESPVYSQIHGIEKWKQMMVTFQTDDHMEILQERVDNYVKEFHRMQIEKQKDLLAQRNKPDEDGFITVTRGHGRRNTNKDANGAVVTAANVHDLSFLAEQAKKKKKKMELTNFYRFQIRETKRKELADLREKFEDDKKRIEQLKVQRKFKPY